MELADAACQKSTLEIPEEFFRTQKSRFCAFSDALLSQYETYLQRCVEEGRNLFMEKYVCALALTYPDGYGELAKAHINVEITEEMLEKMKQSYGRWYDEILRDYPNLLELVDTNGDRNAFLQELRSEWVLYGTNLMREYGIFLDECTQKQINPLLEQIEYLVQSYGFASADEAERLAQSDNP